MAILMPLTLSILHLVEIDGPLVKMWREPGSTWKAGNAITRTRELLACGVLSIHDPVPSYEQLMDY